MKIVMCLLVSSLVAVHSMSCSDCQSLVNDLGEFCSKEKKGSYSSYCRQEEKYLSNRYKLSQCRQVTSGIAAFANNTLGVPDPCMVVADLVGDRKRQNRHQICCDGFVHCEDEGDFRCPEDRFAVPYK